LFPERVGLKEPAASADRRLRLKELIDALLGDQREDF